MNTSTKPFDVDEAGNLAATMLAPAVEQAARRLRRGGCSETQLQDALARAFEFLTLHLEP